MKRLLIRATLFVFLGLVAQFGLIAVLDRGRFEQRRSAFNADLTARGIDAEALTLQYFPEPQWTEWLVYLGGTAALVVAVAALWAWPIYRRLQRVQQAARAVSEGDLSARTEATPGDAIDEVAIQHVLDTQQHLLQAVSHELRTPIARMRFLLEAVADAPDANSREAKLASFDAEIEELDELVGELLRFVRLDDLRAELPIDAEFALDEEVEQIVARLELPEGKHVNVTTDVDRDLPHARGHARTVRHAVSNVLVNAVRYCAGQVQVQLKQDGGALVLRVDDDGPGIPPEEREKLWQPFERLERGRERDKGGVGLGLAIVDRAMRRHGGRVAVGESPLGGARFELTWPLPT
jgi:signal transduction histidine kinase